MNKELQNQAWALLPDDFKRWIRERYGFLKGCESRYLNIRNRYEADVCSIKANAICEIFGLDNLTASEQPKPRFKVGDKIITSKEVPTVHHGWLKKGTIGRIILVYDYDAQYGQNIYRIAYEEKGLPSEVAIYERNWEPYAEPASLNLSQETANCDKSEEKGLNLCSLLQGCESMEFYSKAGVVVLIDFDGSTTHVRDRYGRDWWIQPDGTLYKGSGLFLFPSAEVRTWEGWQPPKKRWKAEQHEEYWYIDCDGGLYTSHEGEANGQDDDGCFSLGNYFRTKAQAEEAAKRVSEVLEKYHEEIGE